MKGTQSNQFRKRQKRIVVERRDIEKAQPIMREAKRGKSWESNYRRTSN